jgi:hypothetical protein
MTHPCEATAAERLTALRALPRPVRIDHGRHPVPQVYFSWDVERANVEMELLDRPGALAVVRAAITGAPRWINLSLALGAARFAAGDTLGLAISASADRDFRMAPFLRSRKGDLTVDSRFAETLALGPAPGTAVLLHPLAEGDTLAGAEQFHTLILPLPADSFTLVLSDLRFLVLEDTGPLAAPTLGGLGR